MPLVALPDLVEAQTPASSSRFDDFWYSLAIGAGGIRLTCDLCDPSRDLGPAVEIAVGSYARPDLRIGLEGGGWTHEDDEERESVYRLGVVAHMRPDPDGGIYFTGGFGWTRYAAGDFHYDAPRLSLGAGWDHSLGGRLRIGNQLTVDASSFGSLKNGETAVVRRVGMSVVRMTILLHRI